MEAHRPKISLSEIVIGVLLCLIADIGPGLTGPLVGVTETIVAVIMLPTMQWYIRRKGIPPMFDLVCQVVEIFPYVNVLPLSLIGFLGTVVIDRNPRLSGTINKVVEKAGPAANIIKAAAVKSPGGVAKGVVGNTGKPQESAAPSPQKSGSVSLQSVGSTQGGAPTVGGAQIIRYPRKDQERLGSEEGGGEQKKEISEEAFGVEKSPFEKQLEPLTELPTPEQKSENESVVDLRKNNFKKAA